MTLSGLDRRVRGSVRLLNSNLEYSPTHLSADRARLKPEKAVKKPAAQPKPAAQSMTSVKKGMCRTLCMIPLAADVSLTPTAKVVRFAPAPAPPSSSSTSSSSSSDGDEDDAKVIVPSGGKVSFV